MSKHRILRGKHPFHSVWQAAATLGCAERDVYDSVQAGRLPLAFDIARLGAGRACLRIATISVLALRWRRPPPVELEGFLAETLPAAQFSYKAPQLAQILQCDTDHIYHLIAASVLEDIGGTTRYRVPRESVARFLTERRVK